MSEFTDNMEEDDWQDYRRKRKAELKAHPFDEAAQGAIEARGKRHRGHDWMRDINARLDDAGLAHGMAHMELFPLDRKVAEGVMDNILSASERGVSDAVNLPNHYARFKIEPIRFLVENFGGSILVGKVVKYTMRYDAKNGVEDLKKAQRCLDMLIKFTAGDADWWKREVRT